MYNNSRWTHTFSSRENIIPSLWQFLPPLAIPLFFFFCSHEHHEVWINSSDFLSGTSRRCSLSPEWIDRQRIFLISLLFLECAVLCIWVKAMICLELQVGPLWSRLTCMLKTSLHHSTSYLLPWYLHVLVQSIGAWQLFYIKWQCYK